MTPEEQLAEFLQPYSPQVQELYHALRAKLRTKLPDACEVLWNATNVVGSEFTWTGKGKDGFIHLPIYTKHVNLGFNQGAELQDPHKLLKGSGAKIRHIQIKSEAEFDDPRVQDLIDQAINISPKPVKAVEPTITIREMEGPKRRPKQG